LVDSTLAAPFPYVQKLGIWLCHIINRNKVLPPQCGMDSKDYA